MSVNAIYTHDASPELKYQQLTPGASYSPWYSDEEFMRCYLAIHQNTLVDLYRCYGLWSLARQLSNIDGCFLEVGVWRGGTGALLSFASLLSSPERKVYLADTFQGVVKAGAQDPNYIDGEHSDTSQATVEALLESMGLNNTTLLPGTFPDDTAHQIEEKVALLHCDVDVYQSAKEIIDWALPRLSVGGAIIFDDYGFYGCGGVTRYVNELRERKDLLFIYNLSGHAVFIKLPY
ncbi:TylF/MycF/NovP-related O-methyltransferase [Chromobacterium aquaticum]|uniref:TylF/MycF/NovP-related O-methyltransferase n=1 Tax=Chromobacterium aquaticum TaxID=467180 RepID=A0ABV8ZQ13_9NEIS|nr:TylF/MycF/NovP-related O-methyltransferase [Chromobacterium aquaticum]MCD5362264.1 TylF/MycF family methyltransferase [Chromobacterium aquaticum]